MNITIQEYCAHNRHDLNRCDGTFIVDSKLVVGVDDGIPRYSIVEVSPYAKRYPRHDVKLERYVAQRDKGIYFAYANGKVAGQIILSQNWNNYAYIDELVVDLSFRRCGIGRALIDYAIEWAKTKELPGIMLETQDINVAACLFYQRCGFEFGGFDRYLYRTMIADTDEVALFWYKFFQ